MAGTAWASLSSHVSAPRGTDFWVHALAYGMFTYLLRHVFPSGGISRRVLVPAVIAFGYGVLMEGAQSALPYRTAELRDVLANATGVAVASAAVILAPRLRRSRAMVVVGLITALSAALTPAVWSQQAPTQIGVATLDRSTGTIVRTAGVRAVKLLADWSAIEPDRGRPAWADLDRATATAEQQGLTPVIVLAYTPKWASIGTGPDLLRAEIYSRQPARDVRDWERFVGAAVDRYRSKVHEWQIWTQLGLPLFRGTGTEYLTLIRAARARNKTIDPQARVATASPVGMDLGFLVRLLSGAPELFDVIALSPNGFEPEALLRPLAVLGSRLRGTSKTTWIDWMPEPGTAPERAATQWIRLHAVAQAAGVERLFAVDFSRVEGGVKSFGPVLAARPFAGYLVRDPDVYAIVFGGNQDAVLVVWTAGASRPFELPSADARVTTVEGQTLVPEVRDGRAFVRLTESPLIVSGLSVPAVTEARATATMRGPLLPTVGPERDYSRNQDVSTRLGKTGEERGLHNLIYRSRRNGAVEPIEIDGGEAVRTSIARDVIYVYFDVDDTFLYFVEGRVPVEITVEVWGARTARQLGFNLLYDSTGGYRFTPWQWVDVKDGWATYTFRLTDVNFANTWGWDFAVNAAGNRGDDLIVRTVSVRKGAP